MVHKNELSCKNIKVCWGKWSVQIDNVFAMTFSANIAEHLFYGDDIFIQNSLGV